MEEEKPKSYKAALIWSIGGILVLGLASFFLLSDKVQNPTFGPPIQSVEFGSGTVFHLYQVEVTNKVRLEYPTKFSISGNGSSGSSNGYFSYRLERSGEQLSAASIEGSRAFGGNLTNLILVGKMEDPDGVPVIPEIISTPSYRAGESYNLTELSWKGFGDFDDMNFGTTRTERDGYWIEVENGRGGWLPFTGPIVFQQNDGRSVSLRQSFPRLQKELKVRITTDAGETKTISIPNPAHPAPVVSTWKADPKPWKKSFSEFDLELTGFEEVEVDSEENALIPWPKLKVIPHDSSLPKDSFWPQSPNLLDETGNSGKINRFPGVNWVRFEGVITRNRDRYPWKVSDTIPVLEYRVNSKGKADFTFLPKLADYFVTDVKQNGNEISLHGKGPSGHSLSELKGLIYFEKGKTVSSQLLRYGGGSSGGGKFTEFEIDFSGKLPAGTEGTLAFPNLPLTIPYEFTIPMDEIPGLSK